MAVINAEFMSMYVQQVDLFLLVLDIQKEKSGSTIVTFIVNREK